MKPLTGFIVGTHTINKVENTGGGTSLRYKQDYHPCDSLMASLFLGSDDNPRAYCVAGARITQKLVKGQWTSDMEYHFFEELTGRLSPEFIIELKEFLRVNKIERVILTCSDDDLKNRIRKELGCRFIFEPEKRRNNSSVILREWFTRNKAGSEEALLRIWGDCREAIKANYPPARDCMVKLLDYYDKRMRVKNSTPRVLSQRAGYG
jgi:hypothetical protein